jgi:hypothetical protein
VGGWVDGTGLDWDWTDGLAGGWVGGSTGLDWTGTGLDWTGTGSIMVRLGVVQQPWMMDERRRDGRVGKVCRWLIY